MMVGMKVRDVHSFEVSQRIVDSIIAIVMVELTERVLTAVQQHAAVGATKYMRLSSKKCGKLSSTIERELTSSKFLSMYNGHL